MNHEYDVLSGYIPSFVQHLKDTAARLGLRIGSQANEVQVDAEGTDAHVLSSWTPTEHDAFFRAISVHSRWRPDLIAACVPTRTEWEVWMYLEALEEGVAALAMQQEDVDMEDALVERRDAETQVGYSCSHSGSDTGQVEVVCEPALEVSQAWIDAEERMASWIIDEEYIVYVESDAAADTREVDDKSTKRKRGRPRGAGKGGTQSRARGQTVSNRGSPPRPPSPKLALTSSCESSRDSSTLSARKRQALMGRLEVPHLLVLDNILKGGEEAMQEKSKSREGSVIETTLTEHGDDGAPRARDMDVSSLSDRITGPLETSNAPESLSNVVIDPALLVLTGDAAPAGRHSSRVRNESTATSCAPAYVPAQGPSSLPNAYSQHTSLEVSSEPGIGSMFTSPQDNATLADPDPSANAELDPSLFSPRTRRRIQKRLYMRRRRARASEGAVDAGIEKLKPGKKAKLERSEASVVPVSVPCSEAPSDGEAKLPKNVPKKNKGGLTLPYKLKAQFAELDVDAAYLRDQGMDLLNMGALGKLMGLYSSLEHDEEEADGSAIVECIDAQLIRHLQAAMVSFVTDVIYRAIVWREREIRLKQRSRAWRHGDQITVGAVEHAVEAIGARYHSHKAYFKSLEAFRGPSTEASSAPGNATEEVPNPTHACVDPDVGVADISAELPGVSPHRDVYTPIVYPPSAWRIRPLTCLTRTYERKATRTRRGTSADIEDEGLMSDETDEEALAAELVEEDGADERDMLLATTHERNLWDAVNNRLDK